MSDLFSLLLALTVYLPFRLLYSLFSFLLSPLKPLLLSSYSPQQLPLLVTIRFSHFCEKVRFALDLFSHLSQSESEEESFHYTESSHSALTHCVASLWWTNGRLSTTPLFLTSSKTILSNSPSILHYLDKESKKRQLPLDLYPLANTEVLRLEAYFDDKLGPAVRRFAYWSFFSDPKSERLLRECWRDSAQGKVEAAIQQHCYPLIKALVLKGYNINAKSSARSLSRIKEIFAEVGTLLADGRKYLGNTASPSAADITFAALSYPLLLPPQTERFLVKFDESKFGRVFLDQITELRALPAGQFVLNLYKTHRKLPKTAGGK